VKLHQPLPELRQHLLCVFAGLKALHKVSSPRESHPQALAEPDVNLSAHPAPIIQPTGESPLSSEQTTRDLASRVSPASVPPSGDGDSAFWISDEPSE
jgi:hypothetical protein